MEVVDFGWAPPSGESLVRSVKITNTGPKPLTVHEARLVGEHVRDFALIREDFSHVAIYPGSSFSLDLAFSPTGPGLRQAVLQLACSDPAGPWEVLLTGYVPASTHRSARCEPTVVHQEVAVAVPLTVHAQAEAVEPLITCGRQWVETEEDGQGGCSRRLVQELEVLVPVRVMVEGGCDDGAEEFHRTECLITAAHRVQVELPVRIGAAASVEGRHLFCSPS